MEYSIEHKKLMDVMKKFFERDGSEINLPLKEKRVWGKANRGYGSEMYDYDYVTHEYYDPKTGELIFKNFLDGVPHEDNAWQVTDKFLSLYDFFGEEAFQEFVKHYYGFDLTEKGNKLIDWVFR